MYHITKSKSKVKPFSVILVADNGEVLSSHPLKTKQACFKNLSAVGKELGIINVYVQDDTVKNMDVWCVWHTGEKKVQENEPKDPKYIPGRNPKKKK